MHAIFVLSRTQLLLLVFTRSRDLSRECHVTKHKTPVRSNLPLSNFENSGTIPFSSSSSTSRGLCPKNVEKRAHPTEASQVLDKCENFESKYVTKLLNDNQNNFNSYFYNIDGNKSNFNVFAAELKKYYRPTFQSLEFLKLMLILIKETFILCKAARLQQFLQ